MQSSVPSLKRCRGGLDDGEPNTTDLAVRMLAENGARSGGKVIMGDGSTTYVFIGKTGKGSAIVNVNPTSGEILHAYTTYGPSNDDNFNKMDWCGIDPYGGGMVGSSVENATFGAGKVLIELNSIKEVYQLKGRVIVPILERLIKGSKYAEDKGFYADLWREAHLGRRDLDEISDKVLYYLLSSNLLATDEIVLEFNMKRTKKVNDALKANKTPPESLEGDPIVLLCKNRFVELKQWKAQNSRASLEVLMAKYFELKSEILNLMAICHPAIAKLGAGRAAIFPLVSHKWEGENYAEITVAYARRCMFYANPIQLLVFWMFNCHTKAQSEVSTDDDFWANKIKRSDGDSRGALDAFLPGQQVEEECNYVLSVIPKKKKLANANMNVLASIKRDIGLGGDGGFLDNPEHMEYLTRIGWVAWFEKYVMGPRQRGPFDCVGTLDSKIKEIMATTTKEEVVQYLETLVASLPR